MLPVAASNVTLRTWVPEETPEPLFDPAVRDPPALTFGVYSWPSYTPGVVNRSSAPNVKGVPIIAHWRHLEPQENHFDFRNVTMKLENASMNGFATFLMIWIVPLTPEWLYDRVPYVLTNRSTDRSTSQTDTNKFPDYGPDFRRYFYRLLDRVGSYVRSLPLHLRPQFVQSAEGSTGDGWGYKGQPLSPVMSRTEYSQYRREVWSQYASFNLPLVVNLNLERWKVQGRHEVDFHFDGIKLGMFSHGYHVSNERARRKEWLRLLSQKPVFSRGEIDKDMMYWTNVTTALYWSALYALHNYLDLWNVPQQYCVAAETQFVLEFFNRYAGHRDPATSSVAFIAFRQGLDAADLTFAESQFGVANKKNDFRYIAIAEHFKKAGARLDDVRAVRQAAMMNRRSRGFNDVGWSILRGNYRRHLYHINEKESTGLWHFTGHAFGRFARALDKRIDLRFHPLFRGVVRVSITYYDKGGIWRLLLRHTTNFTIVATVRCRGGEWRTITVDNLQLPSPTDLPDLRIHHHSGRPVVFHLIEVTKT